MRLVAERPEGKTEWSAMVRIAQLHRPNASPTPSVSNITPGVRGLYARF
ncbi:hypothetical protein CCUG63695_02169 [Mycobacteroides franklinii]|uniref:Uncharacterized protein n=1 Tax=Mycobacteroides franklinii TaxID=948102 RepID=A0A4R8RD06_9MYCO|nr:hypothetical protein CCUG64054_02242 [Mycobacteroides franklinii]TDZ52349.1 hypothetical protein CCUG63697_00827 [Mycobacteroides franklinii]TDZ55756.1 hypothetical protein CCUG63696_02244 [Mycobacteroides franklinii]TDZ62697.1 hypothetical protein CCUG63695_02169 [Mycobacteroides franklinii]TDZ69094.1 hypothetical protein CCUG64056_02242 [Mycobacteroides franklinii]